MGHRLGSLLLIAMLAGVAACSDTSTAPASSFDLVVATDKASYTLPADSVAQITISNQSDRDVYLPMDVYVVCERLSDGEWRDAFPWFSVDGIGRSFAVAPGDTVSNELQLWFYLPDQPGTYRVRYLVYADPDVQSLLPVEERVSPPFVVTM
jgi:hypothetical protein